VRVAPCPDPVPRDFRPRRIHPVSVLPASRSHPCSNQLPQRGITGRCRRFQGVTFPRCLIGDALRVSVEVRGTCPVIRCAMVNRGTAPPAIASVSMTSAVMLSALIAPCLPSVRS
jgi:hypothetical protein